MSGQSYGNPCPICKDSLDCYSDYKPFDTVYGLCLNCGFEYWTDKNQTDLKSLNKFRKENDLKPVTQKHLDKYTKKIKQL